MHKLLTKRSAPFIFNNVSPLNLEIHQAFRHKAFYSSIFAIAQKARVFAIASDFHSSLIIEGKAGSLPVEFSPVRALLW
jgi:hypothetical protein